MKRLISVFALVLVVCGATNGSAVAATEQRIALVIGNSDYAEAPLANPANDARLMVKTLDALGFDVIERIDVDRRAMTRAILEFGARLDEAGDDAVGLFYYAGHGVQVGGENYLIHQRAAPGPGQRAPALCGLSALSGLRAVAGPCPSHPVCPASGHGPQGE